MSRAAITRIDCPDYFDSSKDNFLYADVEIENSTDSIYSAQVVFRGYVKKKDSLCYEFFHEQQWLLVQANSLLTHNVRIETWLPRFPPSTNLGESYSIEYSVRASIDPWFENTHVERNFKIVRTLILKMPHLASFPIKAVVNKCIEHGNVIHRKCNPVNGFVELEKAAFIPGETMNITWSLTMENATIENYDCKLIRIEELRISDPSNYMLMQKFERVIAQQHTKNNFAELFLPEECAISIPMSLWNVLIIRYEFHLYVKLRKRKPAVLFKKPIIICNEEVAKRRPPKFKDEKNYFTRVQDIDDDSEDDDDYDSEDEIEKLSNRSYSTDIEKLVIIANEKQTGQNAKVSLIMNSLEPEPLRSVRLLMTGEVRVASNWYEFMRFKSIANAAPETLFSPGEHTLLFHLPLSESQYDISILPPTMGEEIKYFVRITTENLRSNIFHKECELLIDRFIDTWAKESFKPPYVEEYGETKIRMTQRCFKRGKFVVSTLYGQRTKSVRGKLKQMRRLRIAGLKNDSSYITERTVSVKEDTVKSNEHLHFMHIPYNIPPSIEVSYWNVVQIFYSYDFEITLENGHTHHHSVPIWIGCTEDNLEMPMAKTPEEQPEYFDAAEPVEELPAFEVVHEGDVREQPYWVERYNTDTYS